jgi:hypothetical protein
MAPFDGLVKQALISTDSGWVDADPEIRRLKPDIYVVNEDGDKGGKREYCAEMGMEYLVLKRIPAPPTCPSAATRPCAASDQARRWNFISRGF